MGGGGGEGGDKEREALERGRGERAEMITMYCWFFCQIPPNSCLNSVTDGIATAWKEYPGKRR